MIAIIDYGMGNLRSVQKAFERVGGEAVITQDAGVIRSAEKVVLPGVGAMKPAMQRLGELKLIPVIQSAVAAKKPFLGICLGLQLLFEKSSEGGDVAGLGILTGSVEKFVSLKVPHMGWNQLRLTNRTCPLWNGIEEGTDVYFCHSYFVNPAETSIIAGMTDYGKGFASAICRANLFGVQFHPEKSQQTGLKILENFVKL